MVNTVHARVRQSTLQRPLTLYMSDKYTRAIRSMDVNTDFCLTKKRNTLQRNVSFNTHNNENINSTKYLKFIKSTFICCCSSGGEEE